MTTIVFSPISLCAGWDPGSPGDSLRRRLWLATALKALGSSPNQPCARKMKRPEHDRAAQVRALLYPACRAV
jgi:hypothetical protein